MKPKASAPAAAAALAMLIVAASFAAIASPAAAQEPAVKLLVLGETHGTKDMTRALVGIAASKGASGCVCPGDFIYGHWSTTPGAWRDMMYPFMGNMMPALGNHDPWTDWSGIFPGGQKYFSKDVNGAQFISVNTEQSLSVGSSQRSWLDARLAERDAGALKVVFMHRPWWLPSGAIHPTEEFERVNGASAASMFALMEKHGVDLVVSAHEKNYQHSTRNGVHYLVAGGGGPEFYSMGYDLPGAVKRLKANVVSTLDVTASGMTLKSYDLSWNKVEEFTMAAGTTGTPPPPPATGAAQVSFAPYDGSEWWVQTKLSGADAARVTRVEAMDTGGAWTPLTLRAWGAWATSFRVEAGHAVTYRATLDDGRVATSCAYAHPATTCASATPTPPTPPTTTTGADVAFRPDGGNEWWVQTKLSGTDAARVVKVEARDADPSWHVLTWRAWGAWAGSFHVTPGSAVTYRATLDDGRTVTSCAYAHPMPSGCTSGGTGGDTLPAYAASFRNARGNEWWIEVDVDAQSLVATEARVNAGAWQPLTKRAWGSWATSMHAPAGSSVEFRAIASDGRASAASAPVAWPPA